MLIDDLLAGREGESVDFKRDTSSVEGIVKDYIAFSNASGGSIVVGVEDDRTVLGLDNAQKVEEQLTQAIYDSTEPRQSARVFITTQDDKELVVVDAPYFQGPEPLALREAQSVVVYERVGSSAMPVTDDKRLEQMRRERQGQSGYDQLPLPAASMNDLNVDEIKTQFDAVGIKINGPKLESYDLAATVNENQVPTRAGLVLFGQNEFRHHVPEPYFRAVRWPGADRGGEAIDSREWRDVPLLEAVDGVLEFLRRNSGTAHRVEGRRQRQEIPHYDETVMRELLHNAVAHSDHVRRIVDGLERDGTVAPNDAPLKSPRRKFHLLNEPDTDTSTD